MIATVIRVFMELVRMKLMDLLVHVLVDMKETHALLVRTLPNVTADQERNLCLNYKNTISGFSVKHLCCGSANIYFLVRVFHSMSKQKFKLLT